jgi:hypothetical protein
VAASLLSPAVAHIVWVLRDQDEVEVDYAHFGLPLILAVDRVFHKVRNLTVRHISGETLFPLELTQYDPWVIREALHNCIAHQDYRQAARIKNLKEITHAVVVVEESVYRDLQRDQVHMKTVKPQIREAIQGVQAICDSMNIAFSEIRTEDTRINAIRDAVLTVTRQYPAARISFNLSGGTKMLSLPLHHGALARRTGLPDAEKRPYRADPHPPDASRRDQEEPQLP